MTVDSIKRVRFGLHSNIADFSSTPTLAVIECHSTEGLVPRGRLPLERKLHAADGARFVSAAGVQDLAPFTLGMDFRGVNSNTGGASTWQNKMEQATMLDSIFGTAAAASVGVAPTLTDVSSVTLTVSSTALVDGDIILIETDEGAEVRQVTAGGGTTTITIDRALQGTFTDNSTIIRLAQWSVDTSVTAHIPAYVEAEWVDASDITRGFLGCTPESLELDFPAQGLVSMTSTWHPDSIATLSAANPSYAGPTTGSPIVVADGRMLFGSEEFDAEAVKLSVKNTLRFRESTTGTNGRHGAVVTSKHDVMISGDLFIGSNASSIGEVQDNSGTMTLRGMLESASTAGTIKTTRDLMFQVGTVAGSIAYLRVPRAEINATVQPKDGLMMVHFDAVPTRPSSGSKSLYLGVG